MSLHVLQMHWSLPYQVVLVDIEIFVFQFTNRLFSKNSELQFQLLVFYVVSYIWCFILKKDIYIRLTICVFVGQISNHDQRKEIIRVILLLLLLLFVIMTLLESSNDVFIFWLGIPRTFCGNWCPGGGGWGYVVGVTDITFGPIAFILYNLWYQKDCSIFSFCLFAYTFVFGKRSFRVCFLKNCLIFIFFAYYNICSLFFWK